MRNLTSPSRTRIPIELVQRMQNPTLRREPTVTSQSPSKASIQPHDVDSELSADPIIGVSD